MKPNLSPAPRRGGFTLLEVVLALGILAMLMGMVFGTFSANIQLGNAIAQTQEEDGERNAFFEMLKKLFATLPGNTRMELKWQDGGRVYTSDMTLQNVPLPFTWGGTEKVPKALRLSTVKKSDGYLDIVLRFYETELLQDSDNQQVDDSVKPFAEVVLLTGVRTFEWKVLDGRTMDWAEDWELVGRLPLQMELTIAFGRDGEFMRQIFWIPTKQDPEVMMRQLQQQARTGGGAGGAGGGINLPGGGAEGPEAPAVVVAVIVVIARVVVVTGEEIAGEMAARAVGIVAVLAAATGEEEADDEILTL